MRDRPTIGWREWVALPGLGVAGIKVKIDTGARSSSLHAFDPERFTRAGTEMVSFTIHPRPGRRLPSIRAEAAVQAERLVRNPGGREELRPVIFTPVTWAGVTWDVELNLTRRDDMGFRMLLGRQAVRRRFLVDPGRSFLAKIPDAG